MVRNTGETPPFEQREREKKLSAAVAVLEKAKREKRRREQKEAFKNFDFQKFNYE